MNTALSATPALLRRTLSPPIAVLAAICAGCAGLASASAVDAPPPARLLRLAVDAHGVSTPVPAGPVSPDTPLRITFAVTPRLGPSGRIRILDATTNTAVETIDVGSRVATKTIGGQPNFRYYPVIIAGREADIYPRNGVLAYGRTYYVLIDPGVFQLGTGSYRGIDQPAVWRFATKAAPPAPGNTRLTVAADGTGDFATVQGALDFIPDGNTTPTTISIGRGTYTEIVFFANKHALTLVGEDRKRTVIAYANNERFNNPGAAINPYARRAASPPGAAPAHRAGGNVYHRGVFLANRVDDLVIENLSIRNTTPQGGTQAEAIILNGTPTARAILKDVDLYGYQDTLQINGQAYLSHCFIEGDVDFMWGTGPCVFENCVCRSLRSNAYYAQVRNPATNHGYVYLHCTFDGIQGIMGDYLSRIGPAQFPNSEVVLIDCQLTSSVGPAAWLLQGRPGAGGVSPAKVRFWEHGSHDAAGRPVDVSGRNPASRQLTQPADAEVIAHYRDPAYVLGAGWNPRAAAVFASDLPPSGPPPAGGPTIARAPLSQIALLGTDPYFVVAAAGVGPLHYQWSKDGEDLPGETSAALRLRNLQWDDAANYAVTVSNSAGSVASAAAELVAVAPAVAAAPKLPDIPAAVFDVTAYGAAADGVTDNTAAIRKAIAAALRSGGGVVAIPAGAKPYLCGPLTLGSRINLQIDPGATLQLLPFAGGTAPAIPAYPDEGGQRYADFISATGAHDVAITGGGTIDGQGAAWWRAFRANHEMPHRPFLIRINHSNAVLLSGIKLVNSPMFHVATGATDNLTVFGLQVSAPISPNTDGVDPSGSHQLIQNCAISAGDDNIAVKPGGSFCSDLTVADCFFGPGHGMSVGGQSNAGLDGMTVKNCTFDGTTSGLRLKADAREGGPVRNVSYSNLVMHHVEYPIVFYSYYNRVGSPGAVSGSLQSTPEKVAKWNATPPNALASRTLPSWKNITISNLTATGATGYSTIWGLPLAGCFFQDVTLNNVRISGGPGLEIYDAANVQFTGDTAVGAITAFAALAITGQPRSQNAPVGAAASFTVATAGNSGVKGEAPRYQWTFNGAPLADGPRADGARVAGATTPALRLENIQPGEAGKYTVTVSLALDAFDVAAKALAPGSAPVSATSAVATLNQPLPGRLGF